MGSLERAARVTPLLSPPSAGAGQEQNFPSGKMFVCVLEDGGGAVLQTLELFNDINVFGVWGGCYSIPNTPPALPPSKPRCLDLLIVELSSSGARLNP